MYVFRARPVLVGSTKNLVLAHRVSNHWNKLYSVLGDCGGLFTVICVICVIYR